MVGMYDHFDKPPQVGIANKEFEDKYLSSKLWRINNCYKVANKDGDIVVFRMNPAQHTVYAATRKHPRIIILKSRQQGISTFWLISFFDDALFQPNLNIGLMAQGNDEAALLLERAKLTWEKLDTSVKNFLGVSLDKDNTREFSFTNNSKIFIRVSFRSAALQRLHVSELGKIANDNPKRAKEVKTGTIQALGRGNTGVLESTAEGMNMFQEMWNAGIVAKTSGQLSQKDFYPIFLSWLDDPDCIETVLQAETKESTAYFSDLTKQGISATLEQRNFWIVEHRELKEYVHQEYPATPEEAFKSAKDGTYYAGLFRRHVVNNKRIVPNLYDDNLHTDVYFDLGVDDYTVLALVQWHKNQYRVVKEYYSNERGLGHYIRWLRDLDIDIRCLKFPHDIAVREIGSEDDGGFAMSRLDIAIEILKKEGLDWSTEALPKVGFDTGIANTRRLMEYVWFDASCSYLMSCCTNYTKKWDEKGQMFLSTHKHDSYSHGADALRQVSIGVSESSGLKYDAPKRIRRYSGIAI